MSEIDSDYIERSDSIGLTYSRHSEINHNEKDKPQTPLSNESTRILEKNNYDSDGENQSQNSNKFIKREFSKSIDAQEADYLAENDDNSLDGSNRSVSKTVSNHIDDIDNITAPHSRLNHNDKIMLIIQCAFTGFFSSIAGAIYYPVLTVIEELFHISEEQANISVVVYFIFQGIAPTIVGGLSDSVGRRPVILCSLILYFSACIGLACCNNYSQLIGLRCLQAAGIAPVIAINSGIAGDITTRRERGSYVGYVSGFVVVGSAFGALIGAGLSSTWDWRAIFWFLAIGSGVCTIYTFFLFPETKRSIVGNGSITPKPFLNKSLLLSIPSYRKRWHLDSPDYETLEVSEKVDPFAFKEILKVKEMVLLLTVAGIQFSIWTTHQTSLTTVLSKHYQLSVAKIGLCFLPTGICTMISVISCGKYLNWSYRRDKNKYDLWLKEQKDQLLLENDNDEEKVSEIIANDPHYTFNICQSRLRPAFFTLVMSSFGFIAFGWCIDKQVHLAGVLITSGGSSLFSNCILTMSTTLCVDLFPTISSTATGCLNLFRCSLSAIFIACLSKMVMSMTYGGVFTFLGVINIVFSSFLLIIVRNGKQLAFDRKNANR